MFVGTLFSSSDSGLDAHIRTIDERAPLLFPEFVGGRAPAHLRLMPDELTGRGVALAAGYRPTADTALALYFGHVVAEWPTGEFVMALPTFRADGRT